jgi:isopentenyl phosphate kinase
MENNAHFYRCNSLEPVFILFGVQEFAKDLKPGIQEYVMRELILLKIGGSVCTDKKGNRFRVRSAAVARIGREIAEARAERGFTMLMANGAGPFGHANVTEYDICDGLSTEKDFEGFSKTINDCAHLTVRVSEILRKAGLPTYPYPSSSVIVQSRKKMVFFCMDVIKRMWDSNPDLIPVMNGSMMPDIELKGSVASGDDILAYVARRLLPARVVFASDVDGVYTSEPRKDRKAKLVDVITKENFGRIRDGLSGSSNVDVTGGMLKKVEKMLDTGIETVIVNGNRPGRVKAALLGKPARGTIIKP